MGDIMKINVVLFLVFLSVSAFAESNILFKKGEILLNGSALKDRPNIKVGDLIETKENSLILIKFETGSTLKINANSKVEVQKIEKKTKKSLISLLKGSSFFRLDPKVKGKLNIKTKNASVGVRGTEFFVSYSKNDSVFTCVHKGSIWVSADQNKMKMKATIVKEGEGLSVSKDERVSKPRFLPWTKNLNWSLDPSDKDLENSAKIDESYLNTLEEDYN